MDLSHTNFDLYLPLKESLKLSAGKNDYFIPIGAKNRKRWIKEKTEMYIKFAKRDLASGVFREAIRQGKITKERVVEILKSIGILEFNI